MRGRRVSVALLPLWLVLMLALLQVLFGDNFVEFFGLDLVGNIGELIANFIMLA